MYWVDIKYSLGPEAIYLIFCAPVSHLEDGEDISFFLNKIVVCYISCCMLLYVIYHAEDIMSIQ